MNERQKKADPGAPKQKPSEKSMKDLVDEAKSVRVNKTGAPSRIRPKK